MNKFTVTHEINCNQDKFWSVYFDKSAMPKLHLDVLGYREYTILEQTETDGSIIRKVKAAPKMDMPGPVTKLLGSNFMFTEEVTFDKATKIWRWKRITSAHPDKIRIEGTIRVEPIDDTKIRCIRECTNEARIFGIGGLMESSFEKQFREEIDRQSVEINKIVQVG